MTHEHDLVISNGTVVTPEHGTFEADVAADGETISAIAAPGTLSGETEIDATGKHVLPGAIDPHTHHGIYRGLEADAESESKSDLVGGVTTIGNYFRRAGAYEDIMPGYFEEAEPNYYHDYFFSLGLLSMEHVAEIPTIIEEFGITTFKWYMNYKDAAREKFGVDCDMHDDFGDAFIRKLAEQDVPTTLGYHSENVEITNALAGGNVYVTSESDDTDADEGEGYEVMVEEFPGYAETQSMVAGAALAKVHGYDDRFYAVHISAGGTADELAALHDAGYRAWGETCIHYLALTTEECDERMKVNPPVRSKADQETLWERLADGTISTIGTDHCANLAENKFGEGIRDSLLGFPSTPVMLPLVLSEGVNEGRISLERAVEVTSTNAARAFNLYPKKGTVRVGSDADLAVVDLDETKTVTPELLHSVSGYSPYEGREVTGWPTQTVVKGELAYDDGDIVGTKGHGTHIDRPV
ncbi:MULTISPECIES: dihydroorotase family protein [unclassified Haloferax]|uniref:dihydroorotase n=1 Tax=unclassified Haloferax TaxID=2625095 RepID=UPI0002B04F11|nr:MULTISPECIES: amidohydrolase family protein [unclassified Haloferax]ELZ59653.1 D-hydantoinase [Haloferax sp. ATCC BAA-646]ELZ60542.1 D-hydantoinase [Haloferax sp. ATCC BAA-645]ELZ72147.1 D-hydantoinase [Haloferax sp. ATCC BAA-644]